MSIQSKSKKQTLDGASMNIDKLNAIFRPLNYRERITKLYEFFSSEEVLFTSSFGTKSAFLLYLISDLCPDQEVKFIDTTYHYPETIHYKNLLTEKLGLKVLDIHPDPIQNGLTTEESWWKEHPNMCCTVNKIAPLDAIVSKYNVWISGLMAYQTPHRARLRVFEPSGDIIKFHPLIDIPEAEHLFRIGYHQLPHHPLKEQGYGSVGCIHCTVKGEDRSGRWQRNKKTECGLHTNFYYHKKNR